MHQHRASLEWIESQQGVMLEQTLEWSRINSGSENIEGLAKQCGALKQAFSPLAGQIEEIPLAPRALVNAHGEITETQVGNALRVRKHENAPLKIFLGGHMDTVFAANHPFQQPSIMGDGTVTGPGVADLKGGLSVMLCALTALEKSPYAGKIGWEVLINPDEEIGSPSSDALLREGASRTHLGLLYEPSFADGRIAGARKGSGNFVAIIKGKTAHVGREFHNGRNAIVMLAKLIKELSDLTGSMPGITCNPGKIEGGGPVNQVPDLAILRFNIRVNTQAEQEWVETKLADFKQRYNKREGFSLEIHGAFGRPPKQWDKKISLLFGFIQECGKDLGVSLQAQSTGGCCDGNNLSAYGLPNIDTLGVRGGNLHTDQEYMVIESLSERAKLSALLLLRLASGDLQWPCER